MIARVRLLGIIEPIVISSLHDRERDGSLQKTGWSSESVSSVETPESQHPLDTISFGDLHQYQKLAYEIQDVAKFRYDRFDRSTGIENVNLFLQKSFLYTFQLIANVNVGALDLSERWTRVENLLRSLSEILKPLNLEPQLAIIRMRVNDSEKTAINKDVTADSLASLLGGVDSSRLLAFSRVDMDCLLARLQVEAWPVSILVQLCDLATVNELTWYKHLIATSSMRRIIKDLEASAGKLRKILDVLNTLDPLKPGRKNILNSINKLRAEFIDTEILARDALTKVDLIQLFTTRAMPHWRATIAEVPIVSPISAVLHADSLEFERHYNEPMILLRQYILTLKEDIANRLATVNDIVSLNYNFRIQTDVRWLQGAAVVLAAISIIISTIAIWRSSDIKTVAPVPQPSKIQRENPTK